MSILASGYLNEFLTKWCKNVTFADQVFLQYKTQTFQNCSTTRAKTL